MKKICTETLLELNFLSEVSISPDGKYTAFVKNMANVEKNSYVGHIFIICNETKNMFQLTNNVSASSFIWSSKDKILFSSVRDKKTKEKLENGEDITVYYEINVCHGEAIELFSVPIKSKKIEKINEKEYLLYAEFDNNKPNVDNLSEIEKIEVLKKYKEKGYTVFEEIPFWENAKGVVNRKRNRLYTYNTDSKEITALTEKMFDVTNFKFNDKHIVFTGAEYDDVRPVKTGLYIYNFETKQTNCLIEPNLVLIRGMELYGSDEIIFESTDFEKFGLKEIGNIYKMNLHSKEKNIIKENKKYYIGANTTNSDVRYGNGKTLLIDNDNFYFLTTEINNCYLTALNLKTNEIKRISTLNSIDSFDVRNDKIMAVGQEISSLQEIYEISLNTFEKITNFNEFIEKEYKFVKPEPLTCVNRAGIEIYGYVIKPANYIEGNSYPAILHIHGGPRTVFSDIFHHEMQTWANEGYFVIYSNPRGSDGRGDKFADTRGEYGKIDYEDIMDFTDKALEIYKDIDGTRVGVTGGSYGGFMTNWVIGHTNRFKVACSQRSIANWTSFQGTTDIGYFFAEDQTGADHKENFEKQWEQSPLKYAKNVNTPTLFIHSEEDYRCWMVEALQMFTALKMNNVETRLCLLKGENHELSRSGRPRSRVKRMEEIISWMNKYLKVEG